MASQQPLSLILAAVIVTITALLLATASFEYVSGTERGIKTLSGRISAREAIAPKAGSAIVKMRKNINNTNVQRIVDDLIRRGIDPALEDVLNSCPGKPSM